jgi:hypothetical protein
VCGKYNYIVIENNITWLQHINSEKWCPQQGRLFTQQVSKIFRNRLATWLRPRFVRFHATSCLVNNKRVLLFAGSHMLLRLERMKRGSSYELLPARPKSNSCYCSVNSGACLHCSLNSFFFFLKTDEQWRHASTVR